MPSGSAPTAPPPNEPRALRRGSLSFPGPSPDGPHDGRRPRMSRADKAAAIAELSEKFRSSNAAVLTEYRGLSVKQITDLRNSLRGNATYAVVKNTLTELAAKDAGVTAFDGQLAGPSAIAFVEGDPVEAAKGLRDFAKAHPLLVIKARCPGRQGPQRRRDHQARGPRVPRGPPRQAGRRHERLAQQGGLPLRRPALAGRSRGRRAAGEGRERGAGCRRPRRRGPPTPTEGPPPTPHPRPRPPTSPRVATRAEPPARLTIQTATHGTAVQKGRHHGQAQHRRAP